MEWAKYKWYIQIGRLVALSPQLSVDLEIADLWHGRPQPAELHLWESFAVTEHCFCLCKSTCADRGVAIGLFRLLFPILDSSWSWTMPAMEQFDAYAKRHRKIYKCDEVIAVAERHETHQSMICDDRLCAGPRIIFLLPTTCCGIVKNKNLLWLWFICLFKSSTLHKWISHEPAEIGFQLIDVFLERRFAGCCGRSICSRWFAFTVHSGTSELAASS